jgi:ParB family chromosome partitioning protein
VLDDEFRSVDVDNLDPNPFQARTEFPQHHLRDLGRSLRQDGVIEPILVRKKRDRFEVCAGWMRVLAARLAGIKSIPAIVRELSDEQMARLELVENLKRKDLTVVERARGYKLMQDRWGLTQEQVAQELGLTRDQVTQTVRVLTFPDEVQKIVSDDTITQTHGEALARLAGNTAVLKEAIEKVVNGHLNTSQTEALVRDLIEREKLRKDIREFILSEDFMKALDYLLPLSPVKDTKMCPLCGFLGVTDEHEGYLKYCKRCGWNDNEATGRLWELQRRLRRRLLNQRGLKPYWEEKHE